MSAENADAVAARKYWRRAQEMRAFARSCADEKMQEVLKTVADDYERMAQRMARFAVETEEVAPPAREHKNSN